MSSNEELNEFVKCVSNDSNFVNLFKSRQWTNGNLIKTLLGNKSFSNLEHMDSVRKLLKRMKNDMIAAEKELISRISEAININRLRNLYVFYYKKYQYYPNMSSEKEISNNIKELYKLNSVERLPKDVYRIVKEYMKKLNINDENKRQSAINRILHLVDSVENDIKNFKGEYAEDEPEEFTEEIVEETIEESQRESPRETIEEPSKESPAEPSTEPSKESQQRPSEKIANNLLNKAKDLIHKAYSQEVSQEVSNASLKHVLYEKCPDILKGWNKHESMMNVKVTVDDSIIKAYLDYYFEHLEEKPENLIAQLSELFKNKDKELPLKSLKDFKPIFNIALYTALDNSTSENFDINILRKEGIPKDIIIELL